MNIPVSTVPAAIAYLAAAIKEQCKADSLPIMLTVGEPGMDMPPDVIQIGEVHRNPEPYAMVGSGGQFSLEEKYDVALLTSTWTGDSQDGWDTSVQVGLTERAWQLAAYVENAVRLDPCLGGLVVLAYPSVGVSVGPEVSEDPIGLKCEVALSVHVEATL